MKPDLASRAAADELEIYTMGACHILAVAIHRVSGWPVHLVLDQAEHWWEDLVDADNYIPSVVHAYCVDASGNAWDIEGLRPLAQVPDEAKKRFTIGEYDSDEVGSEESLRMYVGCWGDDGYEIDRPLRDYSEEDVAEAWQAACRALGHLPGFPATPAPRP